MNFPELSSARFVLRQIKEEDLENIFRGLSNPAVIKYYGVSFDTLESTREQMDWYKSLEENSTGIWWAISSKDDNKFLGAAGLNNLQKEHRKAEIGFWLLPEYWGQGIVREVVPHILKYSFTELKLHRIEAFVETGNNNSASVLKKLNFSHEGRMQECEIKNGKFISVDIFAFLATAQITG